MVSSFLYPWRLFALLLLLVALSPLNAELTISGLDEAQQRNVDAYLSLTRLDCEAPTWQVRRAYSRAESEIKLALESLGYYRSTTQSEISFEDADCWHASFEIAPAEPVVYQLIDLEVKGEAEDSVAIQRYLDRATPKVGDRLHHGSYTDFRQGLENMALAQGFFDAKFPRKEIRVDAELGVADLDMVLDSGPRYKFGAIHYTEGILDLALLQRYSDIKPGQHYQAKRLGELHRSLLNSGYFSNVSVEPDTAAALDLRVPVEVKLTAAKRKVYSTGVGFATDIGPRLKFSFANRRRNLRGHQLDTKLGLSAVQSNLGTSYRWPLTDPTREWMLIDGGVQAEDTDTSRSDTYKIGVRRAIGRTENWLETTFLDVQYDDFVIGEASGSSTLVIPGVNWSRSHSDSPSRPTRGQRLSVELRGTHGALGSDTEFLQGIISGKWVRSIDSNWRALARFELGWTEKDQLADLPPSVRFYAGGDNSVRGYGFETLGPQNDDGQIVGGSRLLVGSVEIDRRLARNWALAGFYDSGSAFDGGSIDFSSSVGMGIRWYSPVGPIRVDLAHPLNRETRSVRLHISLGPDI